MSLEIIQFKLPFSQAKKKIIFKRNEKFILELVTESDLKQQEFLMSTQAQNYYHMIQVNFFKNLKW